MVKIPFIGLICLSGWLSVVAQTDTIKLPDNAKKGWTFGALPAVSYNSDLGFQYGGIVNFFHYGNGENYPKYNHSLYLEISRYTKGSGINRFFYDSDKLIPNLRITTDISWLTDKALDFYGFNGYEAVYNPEWEDENNPKYKSRVFYRHDRDIFRIMTDLQGSFKNTNIRWLAGVAFMNYKTAPVDIEALNKKKDKEDPLPNVPGLYDNFIEWGIIKQTGNNGDWINNLKVGIVYDTRDFEANPMKGIWSEMLFFGNPINGLTDEPFTKISITHRQYFTLKPDKLAIAIRLNYQGTISGKVPFYMQPYIISSFTNTSNSDGLGGSRTIRGVLRNRIVGDGIVLTNLEGRWKFWHTKLFKQNVYLGLNAFWDSGKVVKNIKVDTSNVPEDQYQYYFDDKAEQLHHSLGGGLRLVMNENFIVAVDYGIPLDKRDGTSGLYVGLNFLF